MGLAVSATQTATLLTVRTDSDSCAFRSLQPLGYGKQDWRTWSAEKMGDFLDVNGFDWVARSLSFCAF